MCPQQLDHKDARIHCAILNKHTTPATTTTTHSPTQPTGQTRAAMRSDEKSSMPFQKKQPRTPVRPVVPSGPNRVSCHLTPTEPAAPDPTFPPPQRVAVLAEPSRCR